jgi:sulfur carrier protein
VTITVNGQRRDIPDGTTGAELLTALGIPASTTVVEVNGRIVSRVEFIGLELSAGDVLELVTIVGGG